MTENPTILQVSDGEIGSMRHRLNLLRAQIHSGKVDLEFLDKHITQLNDLLERLDHEHRQLKHQRQLEALYNVSRMLSSSLDLETVLDQVMDSIIQLTSAERGFLLLRDEDGQVDVKAVRNLDQQMVSSDKFRYSRAIVNQVMDSGESVVTTNADEDVRSNEKLFNGNQNHDLRSIMATPLRVRGRVIGLIYVDTSASNIRFIEEDLATLDAFSGHAAVAIDNARLFSAADQKLAERVEELHQLRRIDLHLNETLNLERAMSYTLESAARLVSADVGYFGLVETNGIPTVSSYGIEADDTLPLYLEKTFPQALLAIESGDSIVINDERRNNGIMIVPVQREQKVFAVTVLRRRGIFSHEEREIVERVIARAAVAIENARLYAQVQAADRAKSEFVGMVAHDLKAPMTSIVGYTDLTLMDGNLQEQQVSYLHRIRDTVVRMELLVSDLADISRIESGHFLMNETRVVVEDIIQGLRDAVMTQIRARQHAYVEQIEPNLPDMRVDYYRLLQVLTNLASNAYKYTPDGGTITLGVRRVGNSIEFAIVDTGIGLSREALRKLGTKFWRSDDEYTRSQAGTGLGYSISQSLVEQMGSRIRVESYPGKGSRFTFTVPIAKD